MEKAIVREFVEKIAGVSRAWFEWESAGDLFAPVLVIEVDVNTDPNQSASIKNTIEEINHTLAYVLQNKTTMTVSKVRIVPQMAI
jgi:hypothetical protein